MSGQQSLTQVRVADEDVCLDLVVCDDHGMFAHALAEALSECADVLAVTRHPHQAPALLTRFRPDVLLLGARYEGVERLDLLSDLRLASPRTRVVMLVGTPSAALWRAYDSGDVDVVLSKSCTLREIERSVSRAGRGDRFTLGVDRAVRPARSPGHVPLTVREHEVLLAMVGGSTTAEMAGSLGISVNTVRTHVQHLLDKLGVANRVQAVRRAVDQDLLEPALALPR